MRWDRAKVSITKMFLSKRRIFYINFKISSHDDSLMWADFQVYIKDASFREEHFCDWNFRSISSHSWVVLILVRKPLDCFWLWSMVLLAYLSDDSLMWADFQYQTRVELFERNIFVIETFAYSPLIPELYWFSWESLWSVFDYDPWSF